MRYGIVVTQCEDLLNTEQPLHVLKKGTPVRILRPVTLPVGLEVETLYPVFGTWDLRYMNRVQVLDTSDVYELPTFCGVFMERLGKLVQWLRELPT